MNRIKLLTAICVLFLFQSCNREPSLPLLHRNGMVYARLNEKQWSTINNQVTYMRSDANKFGFGAMIYENGIEKQVFSIDNIDPFDSCQKIFSIKFINQFFPKQDRIVATSYFSNVDGDEVHDWYAPTDSVNNNFVTVDSYDPVTRRVQGRFNIKMYREFGVEYIPGFGDTITITNGVYDVVIDAP